MDELIELLRSIVNSYPKGIDNNTCIQKLYQIYILQNLRHSYAELSRFFDELLGDQRDFLIYKLDSILKDIDECNYDTEVPKESVENLEKHIGKLADHLQLESIRISRFEIIRHLESKMSQNRIETQKIADDTQKIADKTKMISDESKKIIEENKAEMENLNDEIKNINTQIVSVIGIFTGIVITIFGSMSLFSSVFSNLDTVSGFKLTLISLIIGFLTFNIIVFMFAAISHLVGKPLMIASKNIAISNYIKKVFWFVNIVTIIFIVIVSALWICFELELHTQIIQ